MSSSPEPPQVELKNRFLSFLIWQSIPSTAIFFLFKTFILSPLSTSPRTSFPFVPSLIGVLTFVTFHLSQLLFSFSVSLLSSPRPHRPASPLELVRALIRLFSKPMGSPYRPSCTPEFYPRAKVSLDVSLFVAVTCVSGLVSVVSILSVNSDSDGLLHMGVRSLAIGLLYGLVYVFQHLWILEFPIIQRPPLFSVKIGVHSAIKRALKFSLAAYLFSSVVTVALPHQLQRQWFIVEEILFYIGSFLVLLSWELSHHLYQVLHTKRLVFAPPKGSEAAETNPNEPLFVAIEKSTGSSLLCYLAYLDLCMVCENSVDSFRRTAFFEETGETYKRVITVSLRPLKELALTLSKGLEMYTLSKGRLLATQVQHSKYNTLNNFQLYAWCARMSASLTVCSRKEDRFRVAQRFGSNGDVISTLLSCLLAVEEFMGTAQAPHIFTGRREIKWVLSRRDNAANKKVSGGLGLKAYSIADVLRSSIYCIVSAYREELRSSAKLNNIEKDWIITRYPPFGTHELLIEKLQLFLDFRAC